MNKFIKLTGQNDNIFHVRVERIESVVEQNRKTVIWSTSNSKYEAKETPEEILQLINDAQEQEKIEILPANYSPFEEVIRKDDIESHEFSVIKCVDGAYISRNPKGESYSEFIDIEGRIGLMFSRKKIFKSVESAESFLKFRNIENN